MSSIYDRLVNAPRKIAATASCRLLEVLQDYAEAHNGVQIIALCAAFVLLCERLGVKPQDAFTATVNLMNDHDGRSHEFRAVKAYLEGEVK